MLCSILERIIYGCNSHNAKYKKWHFALCVMLQVISLLAAPHQGFLLPRVAASRTGLEHNRSRTAVRKGSVFCLLSQSHFTHFLLR
ncbi:hypothetical protein XELAEV_18024425mg [Xenopus laevis]|uniref:Uncharacterized protein n=1 Tax=Xenopus laevis TaxID=8355 RepID=A0A974HLB6_XENLA|nr:hypothetical protein XELAEV_18024425mg [Xenopus laevis]